MTPPLSVPEALQDELTAIVTLVAVLDPLDPPARARVLSWAADYFSIPLAAPVLEDPAGEDEVVRLAATWAASQVEQMTAKEIEAEILESQQWGSEVSMVEGALLGVAARLRIIGGVPAVSRAD